MIVNADDFGRSPDVNRAIWQALGDGLVTSVSLMATAAAFEEASELAAAPDLRGSTGLHLVLTEGAPLTEPIRRCPRFCDGDGQFRRWRSQQSVVRLAGDER